MFASKSDKWKLVKAFDSVGLFFFFSIFYVMKPVGAPCLSLICDFASCLTRLCVQLSYLKIAETIYGDV